MMHRCVVLLALACVSNAEDSANLVQLLLRAPKKLKSFEPRQLSDGYDYYPGACVTGHNLANFDSDMTLNECYAHCNENPACKAFEFTKGQTFGSCRMQSSNDKSGCDGDAHDLDLYVKASHYDYFQKACVSGSNMPVHKDKGVEQCKQMCDQETGCKAFEYGVNHDGTHRNKADLRDCRMQTSSNKDDCDGAMYNMDLYVKMPPTSAPTSAPTMGNMSCGDTEKGFVNHGDPITGWIKSCPKSLPHNQAQKECSSPECLVDPDRFTCCRAALCTCEHGVAAVGNGTGNSLCETDGSHDCFECDPGYHLSAADESHVQTCEPNLCTCVNGNPTIGTGNNATFCSDEGAGDCSACDNGYNLSAAAGLGNQTCLPNTCTCPNGNPTVATGSGGTLCEENGTEDCSSCDDYFSLDETAGLGKQKCTCNPCEKTLPDATQYDVSDCQRTMCEGGQCSIDCPDGLTGTATTYTCAAGSVTGTSPVCTNVTCSGNSTSARALLTAHTTSDCGSSMTKDQTCTAHCIAGYMGNSETYTCQEDGTYAGEKMNCSCSSCNASHSPANGNNGTCTDKLASGSTCEIECDAGYTRHGAATSCLAGTLQSVSTCKPNSCDASVPPAHGSPNDCNSTLPSGATCTPSCDPGYWRIGETSCSAGNLTAAICEADCKCELIYWKQCIDQYGYWSEESQDLDYPGCEAFCNKMNLVDGVTIYGCELEAVPGAARSTKGKWCFAHSSQCNYGEELEYNAAAKCVHFTSVR